MLRFLAAGLLLAALPARASPDLTGLWLTRDHDGIIAVTRCDGGLCAEIAGVILDHPDDPTPTDYRGVSQCHLRLIADAKPIEANLWKGHILDPRNGSVYGVELHQDPDGNLALRGFLAIPLLGETQTWTRYIGTVPNDCRLRAPLPSDTKTAQYPSAEKDPNR
ncbi:MAG TPA: DUF2147 domain-containing protein [Acetobacteraceae bacterium]|jgi:uncharacterized protein (DUF2147 family)|nr:DUF2147 domain-containing protein [Acetobacteraceae bacterium]